MSAERAVAFSLAPRRGPSGAHYGSSRFEVASADVHAGGADTGERTLGMPVGRYRSSRGATIVVAEGGLSLVRADGVARVVEYDELARVIAPRKEEESLSLVLDGGELVTLALDSVEDASRMFTFFRRLFGSEVLGPR